MSDRTDMEEILRQFQHEPDPRRRGTIMAAFRESTARPGRIWARRVPLLAATLTMLLAAVVSFVAGRWSVARVEHDLVTPLPAVDGAITSGDINWSVAESDAL